MRVFHKTRYALVFLTGVCIGAALLGGILARQEGKTVSQAEDNKSPNGAKATPAESQETGFSEGTETVVDYPFSYGEEGWSLILRKSGGEDVQNEEALDGGYAEQSFCLYDESGQLLQEFPCGIPKEELVFRFDRLFPLYYYEADLIVFPADAQETGAEGLCYSWNHEEKKFMEEPVSIPWYQEDSVKGQAFMTVTAEENGETNTIYRINEGSGKVVELRKWTLRKKEETGEEILHIWDCLERHDLYYGKVERNDLGNLVNDKYYQYLFWGNLKGFWSWENDSEIETEKVHTWRYRKSYLCG